MNKRLVLWAITSALAGLLFGFDTVVISGAESKIQQLWSLSGTMHGLAISAALWGTVLGAIFGGIPTAKYGRKKVLIGNGLLFLIGAAGTAFAWDVWSFFIFRFIGGIGIGISTIAAPLFIWFLSFVAAKNSKNGLKSTFCPQDTPVEREALPQTLSRTLYLGDFSGATSRQAHRYVSVQYRVRHLAGLLLELRDFGLST